MVERAEGLFRRPAQQRAIDHFLGNLLRKALRDMTAQQQTGERRQLRAAIIGLGLDGPEIPRRLSTGEHCLILGGSAETHAEMLETVLRLDDELERIGRPLGELSPMELAEIAWRIDSSELAEIAWRLQSNLDEAGQSFEECSAEELTEMSAPADF